jgi:N-acetylglucosamine malate deacetylase 1
MHRRALAIFAHPDDAELACFGSLAALITAGFEGHILALTNGSNSASAEADLRSAEAKQSAALLGAELVIETFVDGSVPTNSDAYECVAAHVRRLEPAMVFTHFPHVGDHQDHEAAGRLATAVAMRSDAVDLILQGEPPAAVGQFTPNMYIDFSPHIETKLKALQQYKSERMKPYMDAQATIARAQWWARQARPHSAASGQYYEAFYVAKARLTADALASIGSCGSTWPPGRRLTLNALASTEAAAPHPPGESHEPARPRALRTGR